MKILNNFLNFIKNNKKNIYFLAFLWIFFVLSNQAFAADPPKDNNAMAFNDIIGWVVILVWLLTQMIWYFLSPEWTNWVDIWILPKLKDLRILVSNVVYFVFALMFVWLAFMNIIWKSDDYAFKTAIPRFIVWVIMVPLSWFIVQFIISLSSILTASVLALPFDMFADYKEELGARKVCTNIVVMKGEKIKKVADNSEKWEVLPPPSWDPSVYSAQQKTKDVKEVVTTVTCWKDNDWYKSFKETLWKNMNMFSILNYYTYWVMKTDRIVNVDWNITDIFKDLFSLIWKIWFDFIFLILYLFLLIILWVSLLVRWIMLWVFMVLSPLFGLLYFIKKDPKWLEKFNFKEFISLAMVPVYVSAALSFGLLFIFVAWKSMDSWDKKLQFTIEKDSKNPWTTIITSWKGWSFTATTNMFPSDKVSAIEWGQETASKNWAVDIILKIFWLWILWAAIVAALSSSEITKVAAEPLQNIWSEALNLAKKAPSSIPIIPTSQWMMSWKNVAQAARNINSDIDSLWNEDAKKLSNSVSNRLWIAVNKVAQDLETSVHKTKAKAWNLPGNTQALNDILWQINPEDLNNARTKAALSMHYKALWMSDPNIKLLEAKNWIEDYSRELANIISDGWIKVTSSADFNQQKIKDKINDKASSNNTSDGSWASTSSKITNNETNWKVSEIIININGSNKTYKVDNDWKIPQDTLDDFAKHLVKAWINLDETKLKEKLKSEEIWLKDSNQINKIWEEYKKAKEAAEKAKPKP